MITQTDLLEAKLILDRIDPKKSDYDKLERILIFAQSALVQPKPQPKPNEGD